MGRVLENFNYPVFVVSVNPDLLFVPSVEENDPKNYQSMIGLIVGLSCTLLHGVTYTFISTYSISDLEG